MGGNALKEYGVERKNVDEFLVITDTIISDLRVMLKGRVDMLPYYRNKQTFGDADILIEDTGLDWSSAS